MKKLLSILATIILTACGGGGDSSNGSRSVDPNTGAPAAYDYYKHDGKYSCTNTDRPNDSFSASMHFSGTKLAWYGSFAGGHEAYVVYDDVVDFYNRYPSYSEARTDVVTDMNTFWFETNGTLYFSVGPASDRYSWYDGKLWTCKKLLG